MTTRGDDIRDPVHWWQRINVQLVAEWRLFGDIDLLSWSLFRRWLIDCSGDYVREFRGRSVWWVRGTIRVLGLEIGAGIFIALAGLVDLPKEG